MALFEGKTPAERNKLMAAIGLGVLALFAISYGFGLFTRSPSSTNNTNNRRRASRANTTQVAGSGTEPEEIQVLRPVVYTRSAMNGSAASGRNIFAYYIPPAPKTPMPATALPPMQTPTPPPPLLLTSVNPGSVFARIGEFTLEVFGDKFTPQTRVYVDNQELATQFVNAQQLKASAMSSVTASPGARQIMARTPDGQLYSNMATLNIMQPPVPTYTYVGILGSPRYNDKAMLKDQKGELQTVQLGDLVGGRFRVTGISERAIEFTDQQLKIKHTLAFVDAGRTTTTTAPFSAPSSPLRNTNPASPPPPQNKTDPNEDKDTDEP